MEETGSSSGGMLGGRFKQYVTGRPLRGRRRKTNGSSSGGGGGSGIGSASRAPPAQKNTNKSSGELTTHSTAKVYASKYFDGLQVFERLNREGFYVLDNFLQEETSELGSGGGAGQLFPANDFLENILKEAQKIFLERRFGEDGKLAGTNGSDVLDHRKRSDLTFTLPWNDKHVIYHCLPHFQQFITVLKETLVPALEEGIRKFKAQASPQVMLSLFFV